MTDIKLSKTQISKINQSSGCLGFCLGNLGKKLITDLAIPITRDNFPGLVSNIISNKINKYERKISEKRTKSRKRIYFVHFEWRFEWYY